MQRMIAKFTSKCATCGARLTRGYPIDYDRATRTAHCAAHEDGKSYDAGPDRFDMMIEDQMAERCGL